MNNIFLSCKKFLVADTLLYQKQSKNENRPWTPEDPPGPLKVVKDIIDKAILCVKIVTLVPGKCSLVPGNVQWSEVSDFYKIILDLGFHFLTGHCLETLLLQFESSVDGRTALGI